MAALLMADSSFSDGSSPAQPPSAISEAAGSEAANRRSHLSVRRARQKV